MQWTIGPATRISAIELREYFQARDEFCDGCGVHRVCSLDRRMMRLIELLWLREKAWGQPAVCGCTRAQPHGKDTAG
jgi:hypothetical protein